MALVAAAERRRAHLARFSAGLLVLALATAGRSLRAQPTARDSAAATVELFHQHVAAREWERAASLLEPRVVRALLDQAIASMAFREAYPPAVATLDELQRANPSMTREAAEARVAESVALARLANARVSPFLATAPLHDLRAMSVDQAAVLLLRGWDPRESHLALNALGACPAGQWIPPGRWTPPRVLGAVAIDDSSYWVAELDAPGAPRSIPRVMGVEMTGEARIPVAWMVAMRTPAGWRIRFPLSHLSGQRGAECAPAPR